MPGFVDCLTELARFPDPVMAHPWHWRDGGEVLEIRDAFHRTLEAELAQLAIIESTRRWTEPIIAMTEANRALGDLEGLISGQPDEILDLEPTPGEWPLREVLHHVLQVELSFASHVRWAVRRQASDPLIPGEEQRNSESTAPAEGFIAEINARLVTARAVTNDLVEPLLPDQLELPTKWAQHDVDVRFRIHRFASHLTEHTIQVEKGLHAVGRDPGEARQVVRAIWSIRGAHERRSTAGDLERLDDAIGERLAQVREVASG